VEERRLIRKQGTGTFVAKEPSRWMRMSTSWESLTRMIAGTSLEILMEQDLAEPPLPRDIPGIPSEAYHFMRRVHSWQKRPYAVLDIYLDQKVFEKAPDLYRSTTVLSVLNEQETVIRGGQTLTISTADPECAHHLGIGVDAPVALVVRHVLGAENKLLYFANVVYRGDSVSFDVDLICGKSSA
jgi:GntR family transcriptional regulator